MQMPTDITIVKLPLSKDLEDRKGKQDPEEMIYTGSIEGDLLWKKYGK